MKNYELVYIIHPDLEQNSEKVTDKVKSLIEKNGGNVLNEDVWGRRRLAYSIAKNDFGIYVVLNFSLKEPSKLLGLKEELRHIEGIIRHLLVINDKIIKKPKEKTEKTIVKPKEEEIKKETKEKEEKPKEKKKSVNEKPKEKEKKLAEKKRMKEIDKKLDKILGKE